MWNAIFRDDILPGLQLLDKINLNFSADGPAETTDNSQKITRDMRQLTGWAQKASDHIRQMAKQVRPLFFSNTFYLFSSFSSPSFLPSFFFFFFFSLPSAKTTMNPTNQCNSPKRTCYLVLRGVYRIFKNTKALPASPKTANAIDQGSDEVTTAAAKATWSNSDNSSLSMFLPRG